MNMHVNRPTEGAQAISVGLAAQERQRVETLRMLHRLRKEASAEIERLLAFMDETDGYTMTEQEAEDPEGEDGDLEPSLCGIHAQHVAGAEYTDLEQDQDDEPSLGWTIDGTVAGSCDDRELAHD